jgi:hypothetical protein
MAKKFVDTKMIAFIDSINRQLIQKIIGEEVKYYAVSLKQTEVQRLYNEAVQKTVTAPVSINALVKYENLNTRSMDFGLDAQFNLEVYFHNKELSERNVKPTEGDFIEYGGIFFEITSVTQPQLVYGQIEHKIMTKCVCISSREGQFQFGSRSDRDDDRSHSSSPSYPDDEFGNRE